MKLTKLSIQNIKSLREITIDNIGQLNVFVGQNNSGKSAIFQALKLLRSNSGMFLSPPLDMIYHVKPSSTWKIEVEFELSEKVKDDILPWESQKSESFVGKSRYSKFISGSLLQKVRYSISKGMDSSYPREYTSLEVLTEEGRWVTLHEGNTETQ